MRIIDMNAQGGPSRLTAMAVGSSRSGKTAFAATWPRPIILGEASEHGWTTARYMDESLLYERDRRPYAIAIEKPVDLMQALKALESQAAGGAVPIAGWPVPQGTQQLGTVIIDSLTFYADMYFNELEVQASRTDGGKKDKRQLFGDLQAHLRHVMIEFHKLPYHIVWTALASLNEDSALRGALIAGQTAAKAPARCDLWVYLEQAEIRSGGTVQQRFNMHTQNYGGFKAGHRFGSRLQPCMEPTFRAIETALDLAPYANTTKPAASTPATPAATPPRNVPARVPARRRAGANR